MKLLPKKMEENGVRISTLKNKIEIERGNLSEWYINEENGLEQGFAAYKPLNEGILQKIDIEISGNLLPKISEDGQAITFYNKNTLNVLHYGSLIVKDSSGEILFSYFEGFAGGISIVFNEERAIYPITVDPVLTGPVWTGSGDTDYAYYSLSVSTAGDVNGDGYSDVIVGAPYHPGGGSYRGRAYLYYGNEGAGVSVKVMQLRSDLSAPISPLGLAYNQEFRLGINLRSPVGVTNAKIQYQIAPLGGTFKPLLNPIQSSSIWWYSSGGGSFRTILISLPQNNDSYIWRARIKYDSISSPLVIYSPWFKICANGVMEKDLIATTSLPPPPCVPPDEPCWIYLETKSVPDNYPIINWQDWNQQDQRTGWNVRRSNNPSIPKDEWPIVASNIVD